MAIVSISEAAKLAGKSRKTIQRYVADGRITVTHGVAGERGIDIAELARVFGNLSRPMDTPTGTGAHTVPPDVAARLAALESENAVLRAQIEAKDQNLDDLRQSLRLLEDKTPKARRRWWLFGA